jgi:hypothetical protein
METIFRHAKFQAPLAVWRSRISSIWRAGFRLANQYQPLSEAETATVKGGDVFFKGDALLNVGPERVQTRLIFAQPRPIVEEVDNLVVTPAGAGFVDGVLYEKYSACKPGLRLFLGAHKPVKTVSSGFFVQSEHIDTFGDWTSEYLAPLARVGGIDGPVFLPAIMTPKPYVVRDAARLGIDFTGITAPLRIEKAKVVRQPKVIRYWAREDVLALKKLLNVDAPAPAPGSMVYLSRYDEPSEVAMRSHPSLAIEAIVKARGGKVVRAGEARLEDYRALAHSAETVLLDHGSAGYNMVYWNPRRVIEFVSDAWWMNSFLMFADAAGVKDYTIIRSDFGAPGDVAARTAAALDLPIET